MCELFGLSCNKKVDIKISLKEFKHHAKFNKEGWGFAYRESNNWKLIKDTKSLLDEDLTDPKFMFKSNLVIGHIRKASCGEICYENTHPFIHNNFAFAHNGTLKEFKEKLKLTRNIPLGKTDSEHAFYYLLEKINDIRELSRLIQIIDREVKLIKMLGEFNFLLSDGRYLFAHGDRKLYYCQRQSPFPTITLNDSQEYIDLNSVKDPEEKAILIATRPLTDEDWNPIKGLMVFADGRVIQASY